MEICKLHFAQKNIIIRRIRIMPTLFQIQTPNQKKIHLFLHFQDQQNMFGMEDIFLSTAAID